MKSRRDVQRWRWFVDGWQAERALIHAELNKAGALNCDNIMLRIEDLVCRAEKAEADLANALNTIALDQGSIRALVEERDLFKAAWEASADVAKKAVEDMAAERVND